MSQSVVSLYDMSIEELMKIINDPHQSEMTRQEALLIVQSRESLRHTVVNWNKGSAPIHTRSSGTFKKTYAVEGENFVD